jgi:FKBP-type peptidyl-prolyl cis-trans isomerase FklB
MNRPTNRTALLLLGCVIVSSPVAADNIKLDSPAKGFSYSLGLQTGENIRKQLPQAVNDIDLEAMVAGIRDRLRNTPNRLDVAEMAFWSGKFLKALEERERVRQQDNIALGEQFRADYAKRPDVKTTDSGLLYREIKAGNGRQPGIGQAVAMHFVGRLRNGKEFGNSYTEGQPHVVKVREMRSGLQEAVTLMQVGAKWEVVVSPELGYGAEGVGDIGPNETLMYQLELVDIK